LNLNYITAIATIIATIFTVLQFFDINKVKTNENSPLVIEKSLEIEKSAITLSLNLPVYSGERNWLLLMYNAAISMPYASKKSESLKKLVKSSLDISDFNMAILAADESPYSSSKVEMLELIVETAIKRKETIGYAVISANKMPYSSLKSTALEKIINAYDNFSKENILSNKN
jgi:hypothetical protein